MRARAIKDFKATVSGVELSCSQGDAVEADKITIGRLAALGFVEIVKPRASRPRKAGKDD